MSRLDLPALYAALPPERQRLLDEVNFLAGNLREDLVLEQVYLALAALSHRLQQTSQFFGTAFCTLDTRGDAIRIVKKRIVLKNDYIHQVVDIYHL